MPSRQSFFRSSVGSKCLIAVSGLSLVGYLVLHLIGNLMVFVSPDTFNEMRRQADPQPAADPGGAGAAGTLPSARRKGRRPGDGRA
jgi:hypothetical protein